MGFPCGLTGKESACNVGDLGMIPRLGRSLEKGKAKFNKLQDKFNKFIFLFFPAC